MHLTWKAADHTMFYAGFRLPWTTFLIGAGIVCGTLGMALMAGAMLYFRGRLKHRAKKWAPVFCKNDATTKT
jgi:hypothetical protein